MHKQEGFSKLAILVVLIVIGLVVFFSVRKKAPHPAQVSPTPTASVRVAPRTKPAAPSPTPAAPARRPSVSSVNPASAPVDTLVKIIGSGFSATGNTVIFRAKNTALFPSYILKSYNIGSGDNGTTIGLVVTAPTFRYGDCRLDDPSCVVKKVEAGEYMVSVQPQGCNSATCESNGVKFVVTQ